MTNDVFGNLGSEMKTMKDGRENLKVEIKDHHDRLRVETGRTLAAASEFLSQTGKANDRLAAQTRHILAQADKDLKAQALRTAAEAHDLLAAIRKAVAALKADAGQIRSDGRSFLTQTGVENTKLKDRTWKMLASAYVSTPDAGSIPGTGLLWGVAMRPNGTGLFVMPVTAVDGTWRTADGGRTWTNVRFGANQGDYGALAACLIDDRTWLIVLQSGADLSQQIVRTTDAGATWQTLTLPT